MLPPIYPLLRGDKGVCFNLTPLIPLSEIGEGEEKSGGRPRNPGREESLHPLLPSLFSAIGAF